jgi:hypothetical protein
VNNAGTHRLMVAAWAKAAVINRDKPVQETTRERLRQLAIEGRYHAHFSPEARVYPFWTPEQVALVGTMLDEEVAALVGRPVAAVRRKRRELGIAAPARTRAR